MIEEIDDSLLVVNRSKELNRYKKDSEVSIWAVRKTVFYDKIQDRSNWVVKLARKLEEIYTNYKRRRDGTYRNKYTSLIYYK